jgi:calcineurin-like phosphoesterase family protein
MRFFTADTHFQHRRIIDLCGRPFRDVDHMDETLIKNWNEVVSPDDEVWHLGDFAMGDQTRVGEILSRLNGRVHLVWGNHDNRKKIDPSWFASVQDYAEVTDGVDMVVLSHYPITVWNGSHHGSYHMFGHVHGRLRPVGRACDVGVDAWEFYPVSLSQVKWKIRETGQKDVLVGKEGDFSMLRVGRDE